MNHRAPIARVQHAHCVFELESKPVALLVDVEGTLTDFAPTPNVLVEALSEFDELAMRAGINVERLHYVTNAKVSCVEIEADRWQGRLHCRARKPFFAPRTAFLTGGHRTFVVGDQYLTDGLLAWRCGFTFVLVEGRLNQPWWPRWQHRIGLLASPWFFSEPERVRCPRE